MTTYIFGDIEASTQLFTSTMNIIKTHAQHPSSRFIFLGDIYDYRNPSVSIQQIQMILTELNLPLLFPFNTHTKPENIQRRFKELYTKKQLHCYKRNHPQYLNTIPNEHDTANATNKITFLFGNKEIAFCQDIAHNGTLTKVSKHMRTMRVKYHATINKIEERTYTFTVFELNTLFTYISLCRNYLIDGRCLYIHCYMNYRMFRHIQSFPFIISGHSKSYGKFQDSEFPESVIYINDLTNSTNPNPINCITLKASTFNTSYNPPTFSQSLSSNPLCKLKFFDELNESRLYRI